MAYRGRGRGMENWRFPGPPPNHMPPNYFNQRRPNSDDSYQTEHHAVYTNQHAVTSACTNQPRSNSNQARPNTNYESCQNQSSPSVPHNKAMAAWLNQLHKIWSVWKKSDTLTKMLHEFYDTAPNPYAAALNVMSTCGDFHQSKPSSLSFTVMEEFSRWVAGQQADLSHHLTLSIKREAFDLALQQRNIQLDKMIYSVYQLSSDKEQFIEPIRTLISSKMYKEACQCARLLKLHENFTVDEFIIPLVLQDKLVTAEEFLLDSPNHQRQLVAYLDKLLGKRSIKSETDLLIKKMDIPGVKREKLYHKPLSKLVSRLTKQYNLSPDACPNLNQKRNEGALHFLLHKRFVENSLSNESWMEMVRETVGNNEELQIEVVINVSAYGDPREALYWANTFGIPKDKWPYNIRTLQDDGSSFSHQRGATSLSGGQNQAETESWDTPDEYHTSVEYHRFPLPLSSIILVNTERDFEHFLDYIKDVHMVGIDTEWKPYFGTRKNEMALLQIASKDRVYILDVCFLGSKCPNLWHELGLLLFTNQNIIKLGFGLGTDISMIKSALPDLSVTNLTGSGYIDMVTLWKRLTVDHPFVFPFPDEDNTAGESLTRLVQLCLGHPLDKSDQFSNWERRPLRENQIVYAALDAYCLLEVYDALQESAFQQEIPFHEICSEIMTDVKSPKKTSKHAKKQHKHEVHVEPSPHVEPVSARNFKVVCDTMVQGLGKMLRKCGVDAVMLETGDNHDECVRIAQQQHRMIITRGGIYKQLSQHVPKGWCFAVISDNVEEQLDEVLRYFNVTVTKEDVFSRCQICNGNEFVVVSQDIMQQLAKSAQHMAHLLELDEENTWEDDGGFDSESETYWDEGTRPPTMLQYQNQKTYNGIVMEKCLTRKGVTILIDAVPMGVINQVQSFYICENCGKCYWDGTHFERLVGGRLQSIVS